jgi:hypothetical protein
MPFSDVLFERMWCTKRPAHCSSASVLLAVALYAINTAILGRRVPTATSPDKWNAYNPLNR